jgi:hypothetical protein
VKDAEMTHWSNKLINFETLAAWMVIIVVQCSADFGYDLFGPSVAATLLIETIPNFKVGLEALYMTFDDSCFSFSLIVEPIRSKNIHSVFLSIF